MNFLFANVHELAAFMELPHLHLLVYLMEVRPYTSSLLNRGKINEVKYENRTIIIKHQLKALRDRSMDEPSVTNNISPKV